MPKEAPKANISRRTPPAKDNSLKKLIAICGSGIIALALVWGIVLAVKQTSTPAPETGTTKIENVKTQRSVTGKSLEEDKKAAVASLTNILQVADKSPTGVATAVRLQTLDKDDYSVIDPKLPTLMHYGPDSTAGMKTSTYQALVTLSSVVRDKNSDKTIRTVNEDAWTKAYGDPEIGVVFVPLSVYTGTGSAFSLEMIYVDGEWRLAPYSLLDAIRLSAALQAPAK